MNTSIAKPVAYWRHLEQIISAEVDAALLKNADARRPLITYLRGLEMAARADGGRRQTVQVIASGRRLLGDRSSIDSADPSSVRSQAAKP